MQTQNDRSIGCVPVDSDNPSYVGATLSLVALFVLSVLIPSSRLLANEPADVTRQSKSADARFAVSVQHERVSIRADEAPLAEVIEEIGKQMKAEVDSRISPRDRLTITFDRLPLALAFERIFKNRTNYAYSTSVDKGSGKITKIVVLTTETDARPQNSIQAPVKDEGDQAPQPFRFEFDPSQTQDQQ